MDMPKRSYAHTFVAALLPGAGLFFSGLKIEGTVLLVAQCVFVAALFVHSLSDHYFGWLVCVFSLLLMSLISCFLCLLSMKDRGARRWWVFLALLPVCLIVGGITGSACSRLAGFRAYKIASESMSPTIYVGDAIMVDEHYYAHHDMRDGDLVAFQHGDFVIVKRVSALPGETIEGRHGTLYKNGGALTEPYATYDKDSPIDEIETFPLRTIPAGEIFVTGDARDHSLDSRSEEFGHVATSDVVAKVCFIYGSKHDQTGRVF
jgi:signal peptidase I